MKCHSPGYYLQMKIISVIYPSRTGKALLEILKDYMPLISGVSHLNTLYVHSFGGISRHYVKTQCCQRAFYPRSDCKLIQLDWTRAAKSCSSQAASTSSCPERCWPFKLHGFLWPVSVHFDGSMY